MANAANNTQQIGQLIMYRVSRHKSPTNFSKTQNKSYENRL